MKRSTNSHSLSPNNVNPLLRSILIPLLCLLLAMLLLCVCVYVHFYNSAYDNAVAVHEISMKNTIMEIENTIAALDTLADSINSSTLLTKQLRQAEGEFTAYYMREAIDSLPKLAYNTSIAGAYYLYLEKNHHIYAPRQGYISPKLFYGELIGNDDSDYETWLTETFDNQYYQQFTKSRNVYLSGQLTEASTYSVPYYPANASEKLKGRVIFYILIDGLRELYEPAFEAGATLVCFQNKDNSIPILLTADGDAQNTEAFIPDVSAWGDRSSIIQIANGQRMLFTRLSFLSNKCSVIMATPIIVFTHRALYSMLLLIICMLLLLVISISVITNFLHSIRKPLKHLSTALSGSESKSTKAFDQLDHSFNNLVDNNVSLTQQLELHQRALFESIVNDRQINNEQVYSLISDDVNLFEANVAMYGIYMQADSKENCAAEDQFKILFSEFSNQDLCFKLLSKRDETTFAVLCLNRTGTVDTLCGLLSVIHHAVEERFENTVRFSVGDSCCSLQRVCYSFAQAWEQLLAMPDDFSKPVSMHESLIPNRSYRFSNADATMLTMHCQEGESENAVQLIHSLFSDNFGDKHQISRSMQILFYSKLFDILISQSDHSFNDAMLEDILEFDPKAAEERFASLFEQCAQANNLKNIESSNELNRSIVEYIDQNYCDPLICLGTIASAFGMTESYVSVLLKRILGQNYSTYLEQLRINHANELLRNESCAINDIAARVGYEHASTFRRAYRRIMGCTPSEYIVQWKQQNGK